MGPFFTHTLSLLILPHFYVIHLNLLIRSLIPGHDSQITLTMIYYIIDIRYLTWIVSIFVVLDKYKGGH